MTGPLEGKGVTVGNNHPQVRWGHKLGRGALVRTRPRDGPELGTGLWPGVCQPRSWRFKSGWFLNPAGFQNALLLAWFHQGAQWKNCSLLYNCLVLNLMICCIFPKVNSPEMLRTGWELPWKARSRISRRSRWLFTHSLLSKKNETNIKLNKLQTFLSWLNIMHLSSKASEPLRINITCYFRSNKGTLEIKIFLLQHEFELP